eukprot:CAMPEP_0184341810 /NCGR_PEP_ID=MMETSP1089-20130417/10417_1 /TAXON_ID=38269 ORGANISM="Gloeochaete wittrockiana, Strain SAG46.84" /NCGR_SAMPLE_ID=MMETSP1089 /ASSEMBLY_ACC=CAM_ASM_000445 /LENGTH=360 /DNA_ID=CAMNT_0026670309 /DNA_START=75 /DNA_END=1157 /DNA_ORIENTATION=-
MNSEENSHPDKECGKCPVEHAAPVEKKCPVDHTKLEQDKHLSSPHAREIVGGNGCPVDHSKFDSGAPSVPYHTMERVEKMGCPVDHTSSSSSSSSSSSAHPFAKLSGSGCPVDHSSIPTKPSSDGKCPVDHSSQNKTDSNLLDFVAKQMNKQELKVKKEPLLAPSSVEEDDLVDPKNMMPVNPRQRPHPEQTFPLTTDRVLSSIPKNEKNDVWVYPSEQMFYNKSRQKGTVPDEESMKTVIAVHNGINEYTWQQILEWERLHPENTNPILRRFRGLPGKFTIKSQLRSLFGWNKPFDRHDWIVDRNGEEVRYIIDYYETDEPGPSGLNIFVDVRPAPDSITNIFDRFRKTLDEFTSRFSS